MRITFDTETDNVLRVAECLLSYMNADEKKMLLKRLSEDEPVKKVSAPDANTESELFQIRHRCGKAIIRMTGEAYYIETGSQLRPDQSKSCRKTVAKFREDYFKSGFINQSWVCERELGPFWSASLVASVVLGNNTSGNEALHRIQENEV